LAKKVGNWIKNLNPFGGGGGDKKSEYDKAPDFLKKKMDERAKKAGHSSWKEYEASGWAWKSGNVAVDKAVKSSSNTNEDKAKAAGYTSWEEYKKAGWKWKGEQSEPESVDHLREAAKIQIKLLGEISHWGKLSLIELKRMSGSGGGGGNVSVNASMPSSPSQSLEMVGDNRNGYASSVYALA